MKKVFSLKSIALIGVSLLVVTGTLVGGGVALAASDDALLNAGPGGTPGPFQQLRDQALENFYKREQLAAQEQQLRLDFAGQISTAVDSWITTLNGKGKDTSALQAALTSFKSSIASAQSAHDKGVSILNTHTGFDGNGNVTDHDQARQTLQQARDQLVQARQDLTDGIKTLRDAVRTYRQQNEPNKGAASPSATPQSQ